MNNVNNLERLTAHCCSLYGGAVAYKLHLHFTGEPLLISDA